MIPTVQERWRERALAAGLFLAVFGARCFWVRTYGNDLPFWDQWDAEAVALLRPLLHGTFSWAALTWPHNEHRLFFTRVTALLLFELDGRWDALLEMVFNAALAASCAVILRSLVARATPAATHLFSALALAVLYALPFGWENTLEGFASQYYFLAGFSFVAISALLSHPPLSMRWWGGALAGIAACFSMASGFFCGAAVLAISIARSVRQRRAPAKKEWATLAAALLICAVGVGTRTVVPMHAAIAAHTLHQFRLTLGTALAFPNVRSQISAILLWLPALFFLGAQLRRREVAAAHEVLGALAIWSILQALAMAYARGASGHIASRYMDCLATGVVCNLAALIILRGAPWPRWARASAGVTWCCILIAGLVTLTLGNLRVDLPAKRSQTATEAASTRRYLATHDLPALRALPEPERAYPDADRLAESLDDRALAAVLPADLLPRESGAWMHPGRLQPAYSFLLDKAGYLCVAGLLCFAFALQLRASHKGTP